MDKASVAFETIQKIYLIRVPEEEEKEFDTQTQTHAHTQLRK